jgi:uncharacterized protein YdhG (YjbR/CyaY superfamily)
MQLPADGFNEGMRMEAEKAVPATMDEYIAGFPSGVREDLQAIRAAVRDTAPEAEETIKYGMPTFVLDGNLVYFAAFKKHIGFYGTSVEMGGGALRDELSAFAGPKGSLKFPFGQPVPLDLVRRIVQIRVADNHRRAAAKGKK